tara:strand:+ start:147 stop:566 length:420 start_codon:yes stop_codon:yes gene_type:complete
MLDDCKPFLRKLSEENPAYQSDAPLRQFSQFNVAHQIFDFLATKYLGKNLIPDKSWFIMTQGKEDQVLMHHHPVDYVGVYYMNTFPLFKNGTLFEQDGFVEAPLNSMVLFPGSLVHTAPPFKENFKRYTMSLNWNFKNE